MGLPSDAAGRPAANSTPADRTERRTRVHRVIRSERRAWLLEGQNEVLELVASGAGLSEILDHIALVVEWILEPAFCTISLVEGEASRLRCAAAPSLPDQFHALVQTIEIREGAGPCANAARLGMPMIVTNIATEVLSESLRAAANACGLRACWSQPILSQGGRVLGTLGLYLQEPRAPDPHDHVVIETMAFLARLAIEIHQGADALLSANTRLAALAQSVPGVVYQRKVSPDGDIRYTYISEGARDLFGVSPEEILADPNALFARHGPEYREDFRERLLAASREMKMWDVEADIITRDGERKFTHAIARPRREPDGSVLWDGIILDATRLRRARDEAEEANRSKSEFLANMSHELWTPLNAILGFSDAMQIELFGPLGDHRYADYAKAINDSGRNLLGVINDILDMAKIESGKDALHEEEVDLVELLRAVAGLVSERAAAGTVDLQLQIPNDLPRLWADARKLKQVVVNLMSNGVKFTPEGGSVGLKAWCRADSGLVIQVRDSGIGIAPDDIAKALTRFGQVDSNLSRKYEGTGLGLPLAKALTELHGGSLDLQSRIGEGTTVTVRLPAMRIVTQAKARLAS